MQTWTAAGSPASLSEQIQNYLATRDTNASVAIYDNVTGETWSSDDRRYDTASIVKVAILEALVLRAQNEQRELTEDEHALARQMIAVSDNDSATTLWEANGAQAGMQQFFDLIGATDTTTDEQWGLTQTTALDQVRVVRLYAYANRVLNDRSRAVVQDFMKTVVSSQHWGVSAGVVDKNIVQLKNGWLPRAGKWDINSIGHISVSGHDYAVAILSNGSSSQKYGIASVEDVSKIVWSKSATA